MKRERVDLERLDRLEELERARRYGAQPSRTAPGVCSCGVCGWRAFKLPSMLGGWDASDRGRRVICRWCRKRGHTLEELAR